MQRAIEAIPRHTINLNTQCSLTPILGTTNQQAEALF